MTPKEVKRELRKIRNLKKEILIIEQEIEEFRTKAESAGGFKPESIATNGFVSNKVEDYVAKIIDYQGKLGYKRLSLMTAVENAEKLLETLNDEDSIFRIILRSRYIDGKTIDQIAVENNYSYAHIKRLDWKGICKIAKMSHNEPL